jgi:hypothetical protein
MKTSRNQTRKRLEQKVEQKLLEQARQVEADKNVALQLHQAELAAAERVA